MDVAQVTFLLFAFFSSVRIFSYVPQILRVAQDNNGASAISYSTWTLWTGANVSTAFYAICNLGDRWLAAVSSIYAVCCLCVIALTFAKRRDAGRRALILLLRAALEVSARRVRLAMRLQRATNARTQDMTGRLAEVDAGDLYLSRICRQMIACDIALFVLRLALALDPRTRRGRSSLRREVEIVDDINPASLASARRGQARFEPARCG